MPPPQAACEHRGTALFVSRPCPARRAALYKACLQVLKPNLSQRCSKHREVCSLTNRALGRLSAKTETCCTYGHPTGPSEEPRSHKHACRSPMLTCGWSPSASRPHDTHLHCSEPIHQSAVRTALLLRNRTARFFTGGSMSPPSIRHRITGFCVIHRTTIQSYTQSSHLKTGLAKKNNMYIYIYLSQMLPTVYSSSLDNLFL